MLRSEPAVDRKEQDKYRAEQPLSKAEVRRSKQRAPAPLPEVLDTHS